MKKHSLKYAVLALVSVVSISQSAHANDGELLGTLIGGGLGAVLGHKVGGDGGMVVGAIAGALIGNEVGEDLDEADRYQVEDCSRRAMYQPLGYRNYWRGNQAYGEVIVLREYPYGYGQICREYQSSVTTAYGTRITTGVTCTDSYGQWSQWHQPVIVRDWDRRPAPRYDHYDRYDRYNNYNRYDRYDRHDRDDRHEHRGRR